MTGRNLQALPLGGRAEAARQMRLTGHKTRSVFDRYDITSPGDLRDAARRLDGIRDTASNEESAG